jgi:hypothetical protein
MHYRDEENNIEFREIEKVLPVPLTQEERNQLAEEMTRCLAEQGSLEIQKKSVNDQIKGQMAQATSEMQAAAATLRRGLLDKEVHCQLEFNYSEGVKRLIRKDTGEIVEEKAITFEERQAWLKFNERKDDLAERREAAEAEG